MRQVRVAWRAPALLLVVLAVALVPANAARAELAGTSTPDVAVAATASSWAAVATTASGAPYTPKALVLSFAKNGGSPPAAKYFYVANTGSLSLVTGTYSVVASPTVTTLVESCSKTWNESTGTCSGGSITTVVNSTASPATAARCPAAVGSTIRLRARINTSIAGTTSVTLGVTLTRASARAAMTTTD